MSDKDSTVMPRGESPRQATEVLICRVGEQWVGLQVAQVREVITPQVCTPMPLSSDAVLGLINLRGRVITQLDVRQVMGLSPIQGKNYRIAIVETSGGEDFGLAIDEVGEVVGIQADDYEPTPATLPNVWRDVSDGVIDWHDHVIVLMDVERFIAATLPEEPEVRALQM